MHTPLLPNNSYRIKIKDGPFIEPTLLSCWMIYQFFHQPNILAAIDASTNDLSAFLDNNHYAVGTTFPGGAWQLCPYPMPDGLCLVISWCSD